MSWFKHAFAIDPPGAAEPTEAQRIVLERLCGEVVRRRMTTPAVLMLEMNRPFNYVTAQLLHFFEPIAAALTDTAGYQQFTAFLEQRGSIDYLIQRLDALETQHDPKQHDHH